MKQGIKERTPDYWLKMMLLNQLANDKKYLKDPDLRRHLRQRWSIGADLYEKTLDKLLSALNMRARVWFSEDLNLFIDSLSQTLKIDYQPEDINRAANNIQREIDKKERASLKKGQKKKELSGILFPQNIERLYHDKYQEYKDILTGYYYCYCLYPAWEEENDPITVEGKIMKFLLHLYPDDENKILQSRATTGEAPDHWHWITKGIVLPYARHLVILLEYLRDDLDLIHIYLSDRPRPITTGIILVPSYTGYTTPYGNLPASTRIYVERVNPKEEQKGEDTLIRQTGWCLDEKKLKKEIRETIRNQIDPNLGVLIPAYFKTDL